MAKEDEDEDEAEERGEEPGVDATRACTKDNAPIPIMQPPITLERLPLKNFFMIGSRKNPFTWCASVRVCVICNVCDVFVICVCNVCVMCV